MKKQIILCLLIIGFSTFISAQTTLTVDAGKDTNYCGLMDASINIGGNPTVIGGTKPYKYKWKIYSKSTKKTITHPTDSGYVDTIANPTLFRIRKDSMNDILIFKVTVTDSNNTIKSDSAIIGISLVRVLTGGICSNPMIRDSFQLTICHVFGGIPPYTYHWTPEQYMSNPDIKNPLVKVYGYTFYHVLITDAIGCKHYDSNYITELNELGDIIMSMQNPLPSNGEMKVVPDLVGSTIVICTTNGTILLKTKIEEEHLPLGSLITTSGIYFYSVTTQQGKVLSGSFVKE